MAISPMSALAAERFVSLTGNDSNSATVGSPLRTLSRCVALSSPGDICTMRGGDYPELLTSTVRSFPADVQGQSIRVRAYPGEMVSIRQTDDTTCAGIGSKFVCFDNVSLFVSREISIRTSLPVQTAPTITFTPTTPTAGQTITVTVSGGTPTLLDWVGWYPITAADSAHGSNWFYLNNDQSIPAVLPPRPVTLSFPAPSSGSWELRMFANDGYTRLAVSLSSFTVSSTVDPCVASPGRLTVSQWDSTANQSTRLTYSYTGPAPKVRLEEEFSPVRLLRVIDTRGCRTEVRR